MPKYLFIILVIVFLSFNIILFLVHSLSSTIRVYNIQTTTHANYFPCIIRKSINHFIFSAVKRCSNPHKPFPQSNSVIEFIFYSTFVRFSTFKGISKAKSNYIIVFFSKLYIFRISNKQKQYSAKRAVKTTIFCSIIFYLRKVLKFLGLNAPSGEVLPFSCSLSLSFLASLNLLVSRCLGPENIRNTSQSICTKPFSAAFGFSTTYLSISKKMGRILSLHSRRLSISAHDG